MLFFLLDYILVEENADCKTDTTLSSFILSLDGCSEKCQKLSSGYFAFKFCDSGECCRCHKQCDKMKTTLDQDKMNVYAFKGISKTCYEIMLVSKVYLKSLIFNLI